jgi:hypothetical protein
MKEVREDRFPVAVIDPSEDGLDCPAPMEGLE